MKIYEFKGDENQMIRHLNSVYQGEDVDIPKVKFQKITYSKEQILQFRNDICNNIDNIIFRARVGAYGQGLEHQISLKSKNVKNLNFRLFYAVHQDYNKYNIIRPSLLRKINYSSIIPKHKKGDKKDVKNYRFLFNHSCYFKLLDKLWTLKFLEKTKNKGFDNNIYYSAFNRGEFKLHVKDVAKKVTDLKDNIILLDIAKAFDSVDWINFKFLLKPALIRKLGNQLGSKLFDQYINLIKTRRCFYKKKQINVKKGIPTGLASSTIIFTLIFDEILTKFFNIYYKNKDYKKDFDMYIFMDDVALYIKNKKIIKKLLLNFINIFKYYKFNINVEKSLISQNIALYMPSFKPIQSNDFYLGIPFSRDIPEYLEIILNQFKERNPEFQINNYFDIYSIFIDHPKKVRGFFNYKLFGLGNISFEDMITNLV